MQEWTLTWIDPVGSRCVNIEARYYSRKSFVLKVFFAAGKNAGAPGGNSIAVASGLLECRQSKLKKNTC